MNPSPRLQGYPVDADLMRLRQAERAVKAARRQPDSALRRRIARLFA